MMNFSSNSCSFWKHISIPVLSASINFATIWTLYHITENKTKKSLDFLKSGVSYSKEGNERAQQCTDKSSKCQLSR